MGLIDDSGLILDLDWSGPGVYRIEDRAGWEFKVIPVCVDNPMTELMHGSYRYSIWQNLNWVFAKIGIKYRIYRQFQFQQNCVGFVAEVFNKPEWAHFAPKDFEQISVDGHISTPENTKPRIPAGFS